MLNIEDYLSFKPELSNINIHVLIFNVNKFDEETCLKQLSSDEQNRADKLKVELKRKQFVIARALLRQTLAIHLKTEPKQIVFSYAQHCKPYINPDSNKQAIEFNISHSEDYGLIAISKHNKIGVDIEKINNDVDFQSLAKRFFSETEISQLNILDSDQQLNAFYQYWVRKESFIKATGKGVAYGLDTFSVQLDEIGNQTNIITKDNTEGDWYCSEIEVEDGYRAALSTNKKEFNIDMFSLDEL